MKNCAAQVTWNRNWDIKNACVKHALKCEHKTDKHQIWITTLFQEKVESRQVCVCKFQNVRPSNHGHKRNDPIWQATSENVQSRSEFRASVLMIISLTRTARWPAIQHRPYQNLWLRFAQVRLFIFIFFIVMWILKMEISWKRKFYAKSINK